MFHHITEILMKMQTKHESSFRNLFDWFSTIFSFRNKTCNNLELKEHLLKS